MAPRTDHGKDLSDSRDAPKGARYTLPLSLHQPDKERVASMPTHSVAFANKTRRRVVCAALYPGARVTVLIGGQDNGSPIRDKNASRAYFTTQSSGRNAEGVRALSHGVVRQTNALILISRRFISPCVPARCGISNPGSATGACFSLYIPIFFFFLHLHSVYT